MKFNTLHGHELDLRAPDPDRIDIRDIVVSLSRQARFNGHTRRFYSVAEHSLNVAALCSLEAERFAGLLHDATEAYLGDVVSPVRELVSGYADLEANMAATIAGKFGAAYPWPKVVRLADLRMLVTEGRDYCGPGWPHEVVGAAHNMAPIAEPLPAWPMHPAAAAIEFAAALGEFIPEAGEWSNAAIGQALLP